MSGCEPYDIYNSRPTDDFEDHVTGVDKTQYVYRYSHILKLVCLESRTKNEPEPEASSLPSDKSHH
jgi:hypothetical protein